MTKTFSIQTSKKIDFVDVTEKINEVISENKVKIGLCNIFVKHTTAAIIVGEAENDLLSDFEKVINLIPKTNYSHSHGDPSHTLAHILSSLIGQSITLPINNGRLDLGTWQAILLVELHGPRIRDLSITITS